METKSTQKTMTCRKDMQCTCPMCLASFQATWDLRRPLPSTNAFQTITNLEDSFNDYFRTPPRFRVGKENETPRSAGNDEKICRPVTPFLLRTPSHLSVEPTGSGCSSPERVGSRGSGTQRRIWLKSFSYLVCLVLIACLLPRILLKIYPPVFTGEEVVTIVEESMVRIRVGDRFDLIQRRLSQSLPDQIVSNCTGSTAAWKLKEADSLVRSECKFFSSPAETVAVWGYPVKTAGILGRSVRDRHLTVISGRVLEWREGGIEYQIHHEGGSWVHPQWAASTVFLEGNTWIVEYKAGIFSGLGSFSGTIHFLRHQARKIMSNWNAAFDAATMAYSRVTYTSGTENLPT
ncbi:unnamed protein product [Calypogeia fissa]